MRDKKAKNRITLTTIIIVNIYITSYSNKIPHDYPEFHNEDGKSSTMYNVQHKQE